VKAVKEFIDAEMAMFREQCKEIDIIVTTALIPGRPAPELITTDMVESMKSGSVIVDLAAERGGNCKLCKADKIVTHKGVKIIGYTDLPSRLATQSSQLYSTNLRHMLSDLTPEKDGVININMEDEVIRGATVIKGGEVTWPAPAPKLSAAPKAAPKPAPVVEPKPELSNATKAKMTFGAMGAALAALLAVGSVAPADFMSHFTVFVECDSIATHASNECDKRYFRHYCCGGDIANILTVRTGAISRLYRYFDRIDQYRRRFLSDSVS